MLRNYLKIAVRNLSRHRIYSFINISGLGIGMACAILIFSWVQDELSYDRFHENADETFRIVSNFRGTVIPVCPGPLAALLEDEMPEVVNATRLYPASSVFEYQEHKFRERSGAYVEPDFFELFSFPMLKGNPKTALEHLDSIVLTEAMAEKYFGDEDPIGKILREDNQRGCKVTGVIKNMPHNTSLNLKFDYLRPFEVVKFWKKPDSWEGSADFHAYALLAKSSSFEAVQRKIDEIVEAHFAAYGYGFSLQPLTRMHLYSDFKFDAPHGDIKYVAIFTLVAIFVLAIACINFMNLATARFAKRAKEVGLRKVIGAERNQLIKQFLGESIALASIALPLALLLVELALPAFSNLSGKPLSVNYLDYRFLLGSLGLVLITGILAGVYPALFLSSFRPVTILKGTPLLSSAGHPKKSSFRQGLVVIQFSLSIMVIIGTAVVSNQVNYLRTKNLGFNKENLIYVVAGKNLGKVYESMKPEIMQSPGVRGVAASTEMITALGTMISNVDWEGRRPDHKGEFQVMKVNEDYLDTYEIAMAQGRFFSRKFASDESEAFVINETAAKAIEMDSPIGKRFEAKGKKGRIIGIVKDFHVRSLHDQINPLILHLGSFGQEYEFFTLSVRLGPDNIPETLEFIKGIFQKYLPEAPFEFHFVDESLDTLYKTEQRLGNIFAYFAILTIVVSCLGLFGLVTFMAEQSTKEIGIRKVLGSSVAGIVLLLTREFTKWVLLSNVIAWPVAYLVMNRWLQGFAYRTNIELWTLATSGMAALMIALLTVSMQAIRAATVNRVESLRYE